MLLKGSLVWFVYIVLLLCVISGGCSREDKGANSNNQITDKQELTDEITLENVDTGIELENNDTSIEQENEDAANEQESKDTSNEQESEDESPWELISESDVNTKVSYAGFNDDFVGVTVGYAGETSYTDDGGSSWSESSNISACRYGLDFYGVDFIVSSGNSGVNLVSHDKGKSWSSLGDFPLKMNGVYNKFLSVIDESNIYIGSMISLGVSNDGGLTWRDIELPEGCTKIEGVFFLTSEIGYLLDNEKTLYKTNNSCESWSKQIIDLQGEKIADSQMPSVAINFQDEEHGMIIYSTRDYKIYCIKTEDGGNTWEEVAMPKVSCFAPYLSRDGRYLTLSSAIKKICLYKLEID